MIKQIKLGQTEEGTTLRIDINSLVDSRMLIQGNSGGGKSWLMRLLCERAAAHVPVIVIDPEGEFASLREKLDMVLVGRDGEIAADLRSAGLLARKLIELEVSAVIDIYELSPDHQREYVKLFLDALIHLPRALWHPTLVCVDEAHKFCPEKGQGEAVSMKAVVELMSLGRKRGYAGILASQRFSKLHNDAIAECNNVFIGRTWLDADQKRAGEYLGMSATDRRALRDLDRGEFYGFGPALSVGGANRFISDVVETTHPKPGERHKLKPPKASDAIRQIVSQLEGLPEQAEDEARTVEELRSRLKEAERTIKKLEQAQPPTAPSERVDVPVITDEQIKRLVRLAADLEDVKVYVDDLREMLGAADDIRQFIIEGVRRLNEAKNTPVETLQDVRARHSVPPSVIADRGITTQPGRALRLPRDKSENDNPAQIKAGARRILAVLYRYEGRVGGLTRAQLSTLAHIAKGGTLSDYCSSLRTGGLVADEGNLTYLTEKGRSLIPANTPRAPFSTQEIVSMYAKDLKAGARRMLDLLIGVRPHGMSRKDLSDEARVAMGGTLSDYVSSLRTKGLIEERGKLLHAADILFHEEIY